VAGSGPNWNWLQAVADDPARRGDDPRKGATSYLARGTGTVFARTDWNAGAVWVAVTHGDIVKSVLADALGLHLDLFQRITISPGSVSIVRYGTARPEVVATNTDSGDLSWLQALGPVGDAPVGGGAGPATVAQDANPARS